MAPDPTIRERVDSRLLTALHQGHLLPGTTVPIAMLARAWGVSETPVREACWKAVGQGWLVTDPGGGFRVWLPSIDELRGCYQCLEILLIGAIAVADPHRLRSNGEVSGAAEDLLVLLAASTGNEPLVELVSAQVGRLAIFRPMEAQFGIRVDLELSELSKAFASGARALLREQIRRYIHKRQTLAPAMLGMIEERRRAKRKP